MGSFSTIVWLSLAAVSLGQRQPQGESFPHVQHRTVLSALDRLALESSAHADFERNLVYERTNELKTAVASLSLLSPPTASQAAELAVTSYDDALSELVSGYMEIDNIMKEVLDPMERQQESTHLECGAMDRRHQKRVAELREVRAKILRVQKQVDGFGRQLDISDEERAQFKSSLNSEMNEMIQLFGHSTAAQASLLTEPLANSTNRTLTPTEQRGLLRMQQTLIEGIMSAVNSQLETELSMTNATRRECVKDSSNARLRVQAAHDDLAAAQARIAGLVATFAEAAKHDMIDRMGYLADLAEQHANTRQHLQEVTDKVSTASERVAMSICKENCSGHGSCWSGTCRCDGGWQGPTCSTTT